MYIGVIWVPYISVQEGDKTIAHIWTFRVEGWSSCFELHLELKVCPQVLSYTWRLGGFKGDSTFKKGGSGGGMGGLGNSKPQSLIPKP